jgi:uncharacterized membrane protein
MNLFQTALALSTLLCSLVAGFVFAFATVVMPGIGRLNDRDFLQAFKAMDGVIQDYQPIFMLVWLGSVVSLVGSALLGLWWLDGIDCLLLILASAVYLLGVQLPTATINVPLNNRLQKLDLETLPKPELSKTRRLFDSRWVRWNTIRTVLAAFTSALLIILLLRL